ncbi:MAG: hypothetical protein GXZ04_06905 [Clostridiales bacterium]|nr:hypothetical protein [Clostridiales bacterium]
MNPQEFWSQVLAALDGTGLELQTIKGLWFRAVKKGSSIKVDNAIQHKPSCRMTTPRTITEKDVVDLLPLYHSLISGRKGIRQKAREQSQNASYVFPIIGRFYHLLEG